MKPSLPVLLCFDVEPDDKVVDGKADWAAFRPLLNLMREYRPRLEAATRLPAHFTWFLRMDPQVGELHGRQDWGAIAFGAELQKLQEAGDEIGLHIHPWRRCARDGRWIS